MIIMSVGRWVGGRWVSGLVGKWSVVGWSVGRWLVGWWSVDLIKPINCITYITKIIQDCNKKKAEIPSICEKLNLKWWQ